MASYDSTIRLRQVNQPELSGYTVQIIQNYLTGNISFPQTGYYTGIFYPLLSNPSGYVTTGQTGIFTTQIDINSSAAQTLNYVSNNFVSNSGATVFVTTGYLTEYVNTYVSGASGYLQSQINSLSGTLTGGYATTGSLISLSGTITGNYATTGSLASLSGTLTGGYATTGALASLSGVLTSGYATTGALASLSGTLTGGYATTGSLSSLSGTLTGGYTTNNSFSSLSGKVVFLTGNQTISGNKTFAGTGIFNNYLGIGTSPTTSLDITGNVLLENGNFISPNGGFGNFSNILSYSSQLANNSSYWVAYGAGTILYNSLEIAAPDGTYTAIKSICTGGGNSSGILTLDNKTNPQLVLGTSYVLSVWIKNTGSYISNVIFGINDPNSFLISIPTTDWKRYSFKVANLNNTSRGFQTYTQQSEASYFIWGPQLEIGSGDPGPYVATTTIGVNSGKGFVYNGAIYSGDKDMSSYWVNTGQTGQFANSQAVYKTGDQTITGIKTFAGTAIFNQNIFAKQFIGIGTNSPIYPLDVSGSITDSTVNYPFFINDGLTYDPKGGGSTVNSWINASTNNTMFFGIGTNNPIYTLDVSGIIGNSNGEMDLYPANGKNGNANIGGDPVGWIYGTAGYNIVLKGGDGGSYDNNGGDNGSVVGGSGGNVIISAGQNGGVGNSYPIYGPIPKNGNIQLLNGNVGIATSSPNYTLDVSGSGNFKQLYITGSPVATQSYVIANTAGVSNLNSLAGSLTIRGANGIDVNTSGSTNIYISGNSGMATTGYVSAVSGVLRSLITTSAAGVNNFSINGSTTLISGAVTLSGISGVTIYTGINNNIIYFSGINTGSFATTGYVNNAITNSVVGVSYLNVTGLNVAGNINLSSAGNISIYTGINNTIYFSGATGSLVNTLNNQTISGNKTFTGVSYFNSGNFSNRPVVNSSGVALSGEYLSPQIYSATGASPSGIITPFFTGRPALYYQDNGGGSGISLYAWSTGTQKWFGLITT